MKRILLIEDDPHIVELVQSALERNEFSVEVSSDGADGLQRALSEAFTLVLLDWVVPTLNGLDVCRKIREQNKMLPIIMLTAKHESIDKVLGLELGADDYLTKPFDIAELLSRIRRTIRRQEEMLAAVSGNAPHAGTPQFTFGELTFDRARCQVYKNGETVELTPTEYELLIFLAENNGRPFSREQLLEHVWGDRAPESIHNVNSFINRIRKKIEADPENPRYIRTRRGMGYYFSDNAE